MSTSFAPLFPGPLFDAAERYAQDHAGLAAPSGDPVRELGWTATLVDESQGGVGGTLADLASVIEALAGQGVQLPVIETCALVPALLAAAQHDAASRWLQSVAESEVQIAPMTGLSGLPGEEGLRARRLDIGYSIDGNATGVDHSLPTSHWLLVAGLDAEQALFLVPADRIPPAVASYRTMEGRAACDFELEQLSLPESACLARGESVRQALARAGDLALLLTLADTVAAQAALLQHTLAHLKERRQFGVSLSTFQVLRHRVADMYVKLLGARGLVTHCFQAHESQAPDLRRSLQLAKLSVGEGARAAAEAAIQMHGGMGLSEEVLATRLAQRLIASDFRYGDHLRHAAQLMHATAHEPAPALAPASTSNPSFNPLTGSAR